MEKDGYKELYLVTDTFLKDVEKNLEKLATSKEERSTINTQTEEVLPQQPQPELSVLPPTVDTLPQASSSSVLPPSVSPIEQQQPQPSSLPLPPPPQPVSSNTTTTPEEQVVVGGCL